MGHVGGQAVITAIDLIRRLVSDTTARSRDQALQFRPPRALAGTRLDTIKSQLGAREAW